MIPLINRNVMEVSELFKAIKDAQERFQLKELQFWGANRLFNHGHYWN